MWNEAPAVQQYPAQPSDGGGDEIDGEEGVLAV